MSSVRPILHCTGNTQYETNKSFHQLLGYLHFAHIVVCPGTLRLFCIKTNAESKASSNLKNIGNVLELSGVAFRLAPPFGGLLVSIPT